MELKRAVTAENTAPQVENKPEIKQPEITLNV